MAEKQSQNLTGDTATSIDKLNEFRILCDRLSTWHNNPFALEYNDDEKFVSGFLHLISSSDRGQSACLFLSFLAEREIKNLQAKDNG